ncbi:putative oxidoreductase [Bisporella sp. PMI_857]|nr:putative oxidoreductase [Bisporella sp. PMI_857]
MAPIRVGLVGLPGAPEGSYSGTSWTAHAHLPYLKASPHYTIIALLNTSVESAKRAIARFELPPETKAYGDPDDLANDKDVDLVVCSVRVDRHFQPVKASIIAGKAVFVEWPLERNLAVAREMAALAAQHNAPTIVGLQGSFSPEIRKLKEVIESGRIGRVVSSSWEASFGNGGRTESKNVRYFLEREVGGNVISIGVGHSLEFINYVLGDFKSFDSLMEIGYSKVDIVDRAANDKVIVKDAPNNVPNQVKIQGTVVPSNAIVSISWRGGKTLPGVPQADWWVVGEKGYLRLTATSWSLNVGNPETKIELFDITTGTAETIVAEKDEWNELPLPAQNVGRLYEAYRKKEWYPNFEWAVKRHETIEELWQRFDLSH